MDDSPSCGFFFLGCVSEVVSFPLLPHKTHSLLFCLDAGVHLCGFSLCQATGAARFLGSCTQLQSKGSKGVLYHSCLCHWWGRNEKDENTPETGRVWNKQGREMKESTALDKRPLGAMAKGWQPSDSWVLLEDPWTHTTLYYMDYEKLK